jgi:hypothetical protein
VWIKTLAGDVYRASPSASIRVQEGKELRYQEVKTKNGVRLVERPEFQPAQHALVLWRNDTPVSVAQGERGQMVRLRDVVFEALSTRRASFDVAEEIARMARVERRRARRRRNRKGGEDGPQNQSAS